MTERTGWQLTRDGQDEILSSIELPRFVTDGTALLAVAVAVISVVGSLLMDDGPDWVNVAVPLVAVIPWVLSLAGRPPSRGGRDRFVLAAMVLGPLLVATIVAWWRDGDGTTLGFGPQFVFYLVLLATADFGLAPRRQMVLFLVSAYGLTIVRGLAFPNGFGTFAWFAALTFVALVGEGIRHGAVAIAQAQQALAAQAAADDRRQIARDVHDVVAHTLAVTMLHVTAARMAVLRSAPAEAVESLEEAERSGRASLSDVRRIVRLLRAGDEPPTALDAAQPDLTDIPTLVDGYRSAGLDVAMTLVGSTERVSPALGLTVYRVAQEALANAARHGDGTAALELQVVDGEVRLNVSNAAIGTRAGSRGSGLTGMEERVAATGGQIDVGQRNGRWVVRARVPLDAPATARARAEA